MKQEAVQQTLDSIEPEFVRVLLEKTLKNSFLFCVNCKRWESRRRVKTVIELGAESLVCPVCNSRLIAALKPWEKDEIKLVKQSGAHQTNGEKEKERVKRVYRNANLVLSHGVLAVITLATRGVGPEVASRIMRRFNPSLQATETEEEHEFYRSILEEERKYARTRRFWDD